MLNPPTMQSNHHPTTALPDFNPRLFHICVKLIEQIPEPYRKPPTPQNTWQTIDKAGQRRLAPIAPLKRAGQTLTPEDSVLVTAIDSHGVTCRLDSGESFRIEQKNWRDTWVKVRMKAKPLTKKAKQ